MKPLLAARLLLPLFFLFSSCATGINPGDLSVGMSKIQVVDLLGKPKQVRTSFQMRPSFADANTPVEIWEYVFHEWNDRNAMVSVLSFGLGFLVCFHLDSYENYLFFVGNRLEAWGDNPVINSWTKAVIEKAKN